MARQLAMILAAATLIAGLMVMQAEEGRGRAHRAAVDQPDPSTHVSITIVLPGD